MCGKALPFRHVLELVLGSALIRGVAPELSEQFCGRPEAFRTSGGEAAPQVMINYFDGSND